MSLVEAVNDVNNTFLSRREITCNFAGLAGKLKKAEAVDMIKKEFKIDDKVVVAIELKNHVGKPLITGTFYVYDDEKLAKMHVKPAIFARLEKAKKAETEAKEKPAETEAKEKPEEKSE